MVHSMTGFAKAIDLNEDYKLILEIKALNHRYLDINLRMPRYFNTFESKIRKLLSLYIKRGKIDLFINFEDYRQKISSLKYNYEKAKAYYDFSLQIKKDFNMENNLSLVDLLNMSDVISNEENLAQDEYLWEILEPLLNKLIEEFNISRAVEGENLKNDILKKLKFISSELEIIESKAPQNIEEYKLKLKNKLFDLLENKNIDDNRILAEVVIYADKICIDEEIVRLKSHISTMQNELKNNSISGKKLDFISQEMHREINTILSKSTDLEIINKAINLKNENEKIREQIQNLE